MALEPRAAERLGLHLVQARELHDGLVARLVPRGQRARQRRQLSLCMSATEAGALLNNANPGKCHIFREHSYLAKLLLSDRRILRTAISNIEPRWQAHPTSKSKEEHRNAERPHRAVLLLSEGLLVGQDLTRQLQHALSPFRVPLRPLCT